jgi:hypothetical protein
MHSGVHIPEASNWYITRRWLQYAGELRTNLLRVIAIGVFYTIHLLNFGSSQGWFSRLGVLQLGGQVDQSYHTAVTLLAVAWVMLAVGVHLALRNRIFPSWLPILSTCADVLLLTCVLYLADGATSPLRAAYFLIIATAALRFYVPQLWLATIGSAVGYICLLGVAKWPDRFAGGRTLPQVPRYEQLIFLAALVLTGVILGQVVRRVRQLVALVGVPGTLHRA